MRGAGHVAGILLEFAVVVGCWLLIMYVGVVSV